MSCGVVQLAMEARGLSDSLGCVPPLPTWTRMYSCASHFGLPTCLPTPPGFPGGLSYGVCEAVCKNASDVQLVEPAGRRRRRGAVGPFGS